MIIYLVKSTLLLALLLSVYKLLLENEKMHGFNRYFLLFALVFGLTAPLLTFDVSPDTTVAGFNLQKVKTIVDKPSEIVSNSVTPLLTPKPKTSVDVETEENSAPAISKPNLFTLKNILLGLYACITFMLLLRFISGLMEIVRNVRSGEKQKFEQATLVLLKEKIMPQSFFRFIFLNEKEFRLGNIGSEILEHELTHVKQLHSLDVLAVEILKLIFWFNPLFYFYKHAIQLNHEFLADEHVVTKITSTKEYQHILMHASSGDKSIAVTSKFSEPNISKRLKKTLKMNNFAREIFIKIGILPFLILFLSISCIEINDEKYTEASIEELAAVLSEKISAQNDLSDMETAAIRRLTDDFKRNRNESLSEFFNETLVNEDAIKFLEKEFLRLSKEHAEMSLQYILASKPENKPDLETLHIIYRDLKINNDLRSMVAGMLDEFEGYPKSDFKIRLLPTPEKLLNKREG